MNDELLEMCQRRFGEMAQRMEDGELICTSAVIHSEGEEAGLPTIVIQGGPNTLLTRPVVRGQVMGIETSQCPVLGLGMQFPLQRDTLSGWRWVWMPMHTGDQRALLEQMVEAPVWLLVLFSVEEVERVLVAQMPAAAREEFRRLKGEIKAHPLNPDADARRAIEVARVAVAITKGHGFLLEIIQDPSKGEEARGVSEGRVNKWGKLGAGSDSCWPARIQRLI